MQIESRVFVPFCPPLRRDSFPLILLPPFERAHTPVHSRVSTLFLHFPLFSAALPLRPYLPRRIVEGPRVGVTGSIKKK